MCSRKNGATLRPVQKVSVGRRWDRGGSFGTGGKLGFPSGGSSLSRLHIPDACRRASPAPGAQRMFAEWQKGRRRQELQEVTAQLLSLLFGH